MADDSPPDRARAQWEQAANRALRGAPIESLTAVTLDGIEIQPLYTREAVTGIDGEETPGSGTFRRGGTVSSTMNGWQMRQEYDCRVPGVNDAILTDLESGITAITITGDCNVDELDGALDGVMLDLVPTYMSARSGPNGADALLALWARRGLDPAQRLGGLGIDPMAFLARFGWLADGPETVTEGSALLAMSTSRSHPHVRSFGVDATAYSDAGAGDVFEIAVCLATGLRYLRAMVDAGMTIEDAADQLEFSMSIGPDQFAGIAKIRAARQCWARIIEASEGAPASRSMFVHAVTARAMITRHDPWVNMLRSTTACFAAVCGGADAVTVNAFDSASGQPSDLGLRIARNTQSILAEESSIGAVIDPAGGSWYVEDLTRSMAREAWRQFQSIEARGGIAASLADGSIQDTIAATVAERRRRVSTRQDGIVGSSEFPILDETDLGASANPPTASRPSGTQMTCTPLVHYRWSEPFDDLRSAASVRETRPSVFLANLDSPAAHTARSTFAQNLLAAGGITSISNAGFSSADDCAAAFVASHAAAAVICSSDAVYAELGSSTASALRSSGCKWIVIAGPPGSDESQLRDAGVDDFVYSGCDVVAGLTRIHRALGIEPLDPAGERQ